MHRPRPPAAGPLVLLGAALLAACADGTPLDPHGPSRLATGASAGVVAAADDAAPPGHIRIGVVESSMSVRLGADAGYRVVDKSSGDVLLSGTGGEVVVTLEEGAQTFTHFRLQVSCSADVQPLVDAAEALGYATYTEFYAPAGCTRLLVGEFAADAGWAVRNEFRNRAIADGVAGADSFWRQITQTVGVTTYRVEGGTVPVISSGPVVLAGDDGRVRIDGTLYRGIGEVRRNAAGSLAGVNEVAMEDYLKGVVPRELPPTIWPEVEALKAQAVAARTYAWSGMGKRRLEGGYDLRATTSDQVYGGLAAEHPLSSRAVYETAGIVAMHGGRLITAMFSSTTGGHTASNEEIYDAAPVAYLRGVPDAERGRALASVPTLDVFRNAANPASLRAIRGGDHESDWSRYHRWTFTWTMEEITRVISMFAGRPVGRVMEVNVLERGPSGRVLRIEYVTEGGTLTDTKDGIRASLRFINASGGTSSLLSTLFFIEPVDDPATKQRVGYRAWGGGWGHGIGLGQTGAVGMAVRGHSYETILKHYYRDIDLARMD